MSQIEGDDINRITGMVFGIVRESGFPIKYKRKLSISELKLNQDLEKLMDQIEQVDKTNLARKDKTLQKFRLIDSMFYSYFSDAPKGRHVWDFYIEILTEFLKPPKELYYLKETQFSIYQHELNLILNKIFDNGKIDAMEEFIKRISHEDIISGLQAFYYRQLKQYRYLKKVNDTYSRKTIEKVIQIYQEFAGNYEKQVRMLVGLYEILNGSKEPDYNTIRKNSLGMNLNLINKSPFDVFVKPFNKVIRNSIAHRTYVYHNDRMTIEFNDLKERLEIKYEEFIRRTKEFSSLVLVLWQIQLITSLKDTLIMKEKFEKEYFNHLI
ncbi:MAG: hypothetical protein ABSB40_09420 [Nitrososphaeria archaeon]|jgi:hypothetical protein